MMQSFKPRSSTSGFTLIEILVIIIIIAVLSAIAAPGWLAFMNNRRISTARSQIADTIRKAQNDAKTTRTMRAVLLEENNNSPRIGIVRCNPATSGDTNSCDTTGPNVDWLTLGQGDIRPGTLSYTSTTKAQTNAGQIRLVFDENGAVRKNLSGWSAANGFVVGLTLNAQQNPKTPRCLVVQTLLGSLREGNNASECGAP